MVTQTNKNTNFLKLSIQVSLNGLSFCILNSKDKKIVFYKKVVFEQQLDPVKLLGQIELEYEKEKALQQAVSEIKLLFYNSLYTLVPLELFSEDQASNYLKFNAKILQTDFITYDEIEPANAVSVYIPYANITNYFFDRYGEFEYKHSISVLIENLLAREKESTKVYLHNQAGCYDLVVIENGKLLFCNSFTYDTPEDFLYYLLFSAEQLSLDPLKFELLLLGDIDKDSDLYKMAYTYIQNISFLPTPNTFSNTKDFPGINREFLLLNSF